MTSNQEKKGRKTLRANVIEKFPGDRLFSIFFSSFSILQRYCFREYKL